MADNKTVDAAASVPVAADEVSFSGDTVLVQVVHPAMVVGAEGSKTVAEIYRAEDAAHSSGDYGVPILAKRTDAAAVSSGTDGDYSTVNVDGSGRLWVNASGAAVPVTDNAGSLTVDGTVSVNTHDVTNAGTFAVQVSSALPAGANAIGKLAANTGVDIGDVDVTSIVPGTSATSLGKAEDAAHASGDTGVAVLAVRRDSATSGTSADGDYAALSVDSNGALRVTGSSGTAQYAEDTAHSSGDQLVMVGAVRRDTAAGSTSADGDNSTLSVDDTGALRVTIDSATATSLKADDEAFTLTVDGVAVIGGIRDDSLASLSAAEGDAVPLRVSSTGALHVTGGGGGVEFSEDDAHASGATGKLILGVRRDTVASSSGTDGDYSTLNLTSAGRLWVSSALDTALPAGTNNIGDVDVLTLPALPAGTNNIGDVDVLSLVPGTGATALGKAIDSAAGATDTGVAVLAIRDDALSSLTPAESDYAPLRVNSTGALYVTGGGGGTQYAVDDVASATATGTAALAVRDDALATLTEADGDESRLRVDSTGRLWANVSNTVTVASHAVTNAGTFATQLDGTALTVLQTIDNPVLVDDAAFTPATSSVSMAGFQADESSTDSVDEGDAGAARMTLDRKIIVTPQPHTAGGLSIFRSIDLDETEEEVKATAGQVYAMWVTNTATATRFVKFYNATAANVTVGTTTPVITIGIPGNSSDDISGNFGPGGMGIAFDTAITVAATTAVADADTGAPSANDVIVNIFYK